MAVTSTFSALQLFTTQLSAELAVPCCSCTPKAVYKMHIAAGFTHIERGGSWGRSAVVYNKAVERMQLSCDAVLIALQLLTARVG